MVTMLILEVAWLSIARVISGVYIYIAVRSL